MWEYNPGRPHHFLRYISSNPLEFLCFTQGLCKGVEQMVGQSTRYLYQKRGVYYFSRRVPEDLLNHYRRSKIALSLRTKSLKVAIAKSTSPASQLDEEWLTLGWRRNDSPLRKFLH